MARKEKKYHFIYKTINLINGKYYYGMHSTDNLNDGYYGSGRRLKRSLNKYGKLNHKVEIIEFLPDRKSLIKREMDIVNLNEVGNKECMNLRIGGTGGLIGLPEKTREKIRQGASNFLKNKWKDPEFAKKCNRLSSERMKEHHKNHKIKYSNTLGRNHTEETKKLIGQINSILQKGEKNSQYGTCWITKNNINKKIKKTDIEIFEKDGWRKGRVIIK